MFFGWIFDLGGGGDESELGEGGGVEGGVKVMKC